MGSWITEFSWKEFKMVLLLKLMVFDDYYYTSRSFQIKYTELKLPSNLFLFY